MWKGKEPGRFVRAVAVRRPCLGYPASADKRPGHQGKIPIPSAVRPYCILWGGVPGYCAGNGNSAWKLRQGETDVPGQRLPKFRSESGDIVSVVQDRRFPGACIAACTDRMSELVPSGCGVSSHRCSKERLPVGIVLPSAVAA